MFEGQPCCRGPAPVDEPSAEWLALAVLGPDVGLPARADVWAGTMTGAGR